MIGDNTCELAKMLENFTGGNEKKLKEKFLPRKS